MQCEECDLTFGIPDLPVSESDFNSYPWTIEWTKNFARHVSKAAHALGGKLKVAQRITEPIASLLDIGCGNGAFLAAAERIGLYAEGIDIDRDHTKFAIDQGLKAFHCDIKDYTPARQFDFIHIKESFHLVTDTREFVQRVASFMDHRTVLYIDSTHGDGLASRYRKWKVKPPRYGQLYPPLHNRTFNRRSMRYVLENAGLRVVNIRSFNRGNAVYCPSSRRSMRQYIVNPFLDGFFLGGFIGCYAVKAH